MDYSRRLAHNPNLKEKFGARQDTPRQTQKEDKPPTKEIAEAFSTITGQEIGEEEAGLIQGIQLPDEEDSNFTKDTEALEEGENNKWLVNQYNPNEYFVECVCSGIEYVFNIILGKEMGTTFPISVQDKEVNALLDTGAEKSCMSMDMFARLKLPLNIAKVQKLRNASGKDIKMHGVMTAKFKMGNTIFTQEFVVCDNLVRPIIIGRDFTVNNF